MLDFIGMVITAALMVVIVNALTIFMDVSRAARIALAAVIGVWIGLAAAVAQAGWLAGSRPISVGLFVVVPLVAAACSTAWPAARQAMLSIPVPVLVALNVARVFAVLFLMLAAEGRLSGPFPYSAAWGDIITGAAAVPLLWLLKDGVARHATTIAIWNLFGAADLVLAIGFGITSAEGSPLQLFPAPGSEAMQHAPWSFVPTVLVPIWLILHAIIAVGEAFVNEAVSNKVSLLCTDQWVGYKHLDRRFPHAKIDHAKGQYVVGAVHTNTIEGFWSIMKRGVVGTFHRVSKKYMPLYVAEFQFRYNNRSNPDIFARATRPSYD